MALCVGFDTSNYTTSVAWCDSAEGRNESRILDVPDGALGLRQSDALFLHVRRLPQLMESFRRYHRASACCSQGCGCSCRKNRRHNRYFCRTAVGSYRCFIGPSVSRGETHRCAFATGKPGGVVPRQAERIGIFPVWHGKQSESYA